MSLCRKHKTISSYALLSEGGTGTLCNMCALEEEIANLRDALDGIKQKASFQSSSFARDIATIADEVLKGEK